MMPRLQLAAIIAAVLSVLTVAIVLYVGPAVHVVIVVPPPTPALVVEICAAAAGVAGAWLLARNGKYAGWGFVAYLVSNAAWIAFAWSGRHWFMLVQQLAFTAVSLYGIWCWLLAPRVDQLLDAALDGSPV